MHLHSSVTYYLLDRWPVSSDVCLATISACLVEDFDFSTDARWSVKAFTNNCLHIWHLFPKKKNDIQHCHCQVNKPACMLHGEWNSRHMCKEFAESGTSSLYRLEQFNIYNASSPILLTKLPLAMEACQAARVSLSLEVAATVVKDKPAGLFHPQWRKSAGQEKGDSYMCIICSTQRHNLCVSILYIPV